MRLVPAACRLPLPTARRFVRLLLCAAAVAPLAGTGCSWLNKGRPDPRPKAGGALPPVEADRLVAYLNERAGRLQSITYNQVSMRVNDGHIITPELSGGGLACAQPRNFRMTGTGSLAGEVDIGSNSEQFWVYAKATGSPMYVFCNYADFDTGRAKLPGGLPFEPDWVMQVLGMVPLQEGKDYAVTPSDKDRTYTLGWSAKTPQGQSVRKEIVFDADPATGTRPQVKRHVVRDGATNKVIAVADIKRAQTAAAGTDPRTNGPGAIQYPTQVTLRWEEQKFEMDLRLDQAEINRPPAGPNLFRMPQNKGARPIDLAQYEFRQ